MGAFGWFEHMKLERLGQNDTTICQGGACVQEGNYKHTIHQN